MRYVDPRSGTRPFAGVVVTSLLVGGLCLGAVPAAATPEAAPGNGDQQAVGLHVGVSGITSQSQVEVGPQVVAGGPLSVRGSALVPLVPYDVWLHSADAPPVRLGSVVSLADGTFELSTLLPAAAGPGTYFVRVSDPATGVFLDTATFEVGAAEEPGGPATGPGTGSVTGPGTGSGSGTGGLAATGPLPAGDRGTGTPGRLAFTGVTLAGTLAAAGALVVTGVVVATGAARRRRRVHQA